MERHQHVLVGLGTSEKAPFTPVQVQKLFFLLDRNGGGDHFSCPQFDFKPYDFGPFDAEVYKELEGLSNAGLVEISYDRTGLKHFRLTAAGQQSANEVFAQLDERSQVFVARVSDWVREQTFTSLLSSMYRHYPDMAVNSVFRQH